ncbi:phage tail tape measure protein [Pontibacter litorisediminis]|uniref:phage tail tape measure protein n=1 Tax=Pontibacter litorisediminis TaxID=1846260 RepID=UPI0023EB5E19|nr:phage tail tape measure protein [Pontibacter litorisediminis]
MATNKETREIEIILNGQKVSASLKEMNAAAALMNNQLKKMSADDPKREALKKDFHAMRDRIKEMRTELYGVEKASATAKAGLGGMTSATGLLKAGFKAAVAAFLPLLAFQELVNLGRHLLGIVDNVDKIRGSWQRLGVTQTEELDALYVLTEAFSKTFDQEHQDVIKSANVLAKEFKISYGEAFDMLEKGFLAGGNASGEMLDQIKEYSTQFAGAGASAEDFMMVLVDAENKGIFSDKAADTVKEFGLRIREQTTATRDALDDAFGQEFTDKIFKGINDGSLSTIDALKQVSAQMNDTTVPASKLQTVVADVFGGPGEDVGMEYLKSLQEIGGELDAMVDKNNNLTSAQMDQLEAEKLLAEAQAELGESFSGTGSTLQWLWTMTQAYGMKVLNFFVDGTRLLRDDIVGLGFVFAEVWKSITAGWDALMSGDFSGIGDAFKGLGGRVEKAFTQGRLHYRLKAQEDEKKLQQQENDKAVAEAAAQARKEAEATRKEKEAAAKASAREAERQRKEEARAMEKALGDYAKAKEKAQTELAKLMVQVQRDGLSKELEALRLHYEEDKAEREKHKTEVLENIAATEEEKQELLATYAEQQRLKDEEYKLAQEETKQADRELQREEYFAQLEEEEEYQAIAREEQFLRAYDAEAAQEQALLELHQQTLHQKLEFLQAAGQGETLEALKIKNEILHIEKEKTEKSKALAQERANFERSMAEMRLSIAGDTLDGLMGFLNEESAAYQVFKAIRKTLTVAEIIMNLEKELAFNAVAAAANPLNAVTFGAAGVAQLKAANILSTVRAGISMAKVVAFEQGGFTGSGGKTIPMKEVNGLWQTASGFSGGSIGAFADGGFVNNAQLGLIGERGRELVLPNWMVESPKYANVVQWLEAERQKGVRAFADGGMTTPAPAPALPNSNYENRALTKFEEQLLQEVREMKQEVLSWPNRLEVHNNIGDTREKLQQLNELERRAFG